MPVGPGTRSSATNSKTCAIPGVSVRSWMKIEHTFSTTPTSSNSTGGEGQNQRPGRYPDALSTNVSDIKSGDVLFADGRLNDALTVYVRRLRTCESTIASGKANIQAIEDRDILARRTSDVAFGFLQQGEFQKALAATEAYSYSPLGSANQLPPLLDIRRTHALLLLDRLEEANSIYLKHRSAKVDAERLAEELIAQDFATLQAAGWTHPLMNTSHPEQPPQT